MEEPKRRKRYSEAVKIKVVDELEKGRLTVAEVRERYGIPGNHTIQDWVKRYGKAGGGKRGLGRKMLQSARIERLEAQNRELESALARSCVKVAALESLLEEAEEVYGPGLKKNFGTGPSGVRRER